MTKLVPAMPSHGKRDESGLSDCDIESRPHEKPP